LSRLARARPSGSPSRWAGDDWITVSPIAPADPFNGNDNEWPALNHSGADIATLNGMPWSNLDPG
jgi:hypothetical protein